MMTERESVVGQLATLQQQIDVLGLQHHELCMRLCTLKDERLVAQSRLRQIDRIRGRRRHLV